MQTKRQDVDEEYGCLDEEYGCLDEEYGLQKEWDEF